MDHRKMALLIVLGGALAVPLLTLPIVPGTGKVFIVSINTCPGAPCPSGPPTALTYHFTQSLARYVSGVGVVCYQDSYCEFDW